MAKNCNILNKKDLFMNTKFISTKLLLTFFISIFTSTVFAMIDGEHDQALSYWLARVPTDFRARVDRNNLDNTRGYRLEGTLSDSDQFSNSTQRELSQEFSILSAAACRGYSKEDLGQPKVDPALKDLLHATLFGNWQNFLDSVCRIDIFYANHKTAEARSYMGMFLAAISNRRFGTIATNRLQDSLFSSQDRDVQIKADLDLALKFMKWQLTHSSIINGGYHQDYVIVNSIWSQDIKNILFILFVSGTLEWPNPLPENCFGLVKLLVDIFKRHGHPEAENLGVIIKNKLRQTRPGYDFDFLDVIFNSVGKKRNAEELPENFSKRRRISVVTDDYDLYNS